MTIEIKDNECLVDSGVGHENNFCGVFHDVQYYYTYSEAAYKYVIIGFKSGTKIGPKRIESTDVVHVIPSI